MIAPIIFRSIRLLLMTAIALWLVGCSGSAPTATTLPSTPVADVAATTEATAATTLDLQAAPTLDVPTIPPDSTQPPFPTIRPTIEGEIIAQDSRTLVASRTEDPNSGEPFTSIRIERNGGPGASLTTPNPPLVIEIQGSGQVTYGDQEGQLAQSVVDQLNTRIRTIDFFGVSGDFIGVLPLEGSEDYLYKVTITRGALTRSIDARDTVMPQELREFIAYLLQTAQQGAQQNSQQLSAPATEIQVTDAPAGQATEQVTEQATSAS
jgi:hypothetical protein